MNIEKEKELYKQMDLLQMKEVSTYRQQKNGTRIFQLPIKKYGQYIEVGSFKSGYVRRMNGCYTPYQLNKTEKYDHYYKMYDYKDGYKGFSGNYRKHECVKRILIPNELDRLEYLIAFCLKNYYINPANEVEETKKYTQKLINELQDIKRNDGDIYNDGFHAGKQEPEVSVTVNGHKYKVI